MSNHHPPSVRDVDVAALYGALVAKLEQARQRRIESGRAGFTDLDDAGRREYKRRKQAERRVRLAAQHAATGSAPFDAANMKAAIVDAVMALAAAGDERVDAILKLASTAFAVPAAAEDNMRRRSVRHSPRVLRVTDTAE